MNLTKGEKSSLLKIGFWTLLSTTIPLFPLFAVQWLFNDLIMSGSIGLIWQISFGVALAALSTAFILFLRNIGLLRLEGALSHRIESATWARLFKLPMNYFQNRTKVELEEAAMGFERIRRELSEAGAELILSGCFSFTYLAAMFFFSPLFALISLLPISASAWLTYLLTQKKKGYKTRTNDLQQQLSSLVTESLISLKRIRASGIESHISSRSKNLLAQQLDLEEEAARMRRRLTVLSRFTPFLLLGVYLILIANTSQPPKMGTFFAYYLALFTFCSVAHDLAHLLANMNFEWPKINESKWLLEKHEEKSELIRGEISFQNVSFRYSENDDYLFKDLSLSIASGEKIGITGPSGAGRTTLLRLLLGFESPSSGNIHIDGNTGKASMRKQMGVVFRTEDIFAGTVHENIDVGRELPFEKIEQAAHLSGFSKDLAQLPMGYAAVIPQGGDIFSDGQKQRLLIARALANQPAILILDQTLDSLDRISRTEILENLKALQGTQIIISQEVETLKPYVDKLYVLDAGKITALR